MPLQSQYASLPHAFYQKVSPATFPMPQLFLFNHKLAESLDLDELQTSQDNLALLLSGQELFPGSHPIAQAYAGHQFGHFVPELGDGRAHLLGEIQNKEGKLVDVGLKGSGQTRFSRNADGRAHLGHTLREYIMSEAMYHLGVPTSRSLAIVSTGESVRRETEFPGAVLTRVADSHIRVGTFEYFAHRGDQENLQRLIDFAIKRHVPNARNQKEKNLYLIDHVANKQISLIAQWMGIGFIHGVMNTDNCFISGQTLDYGPCAMMDHFRSQQVFSSIDHHGRYAYHNQPNIILWNLASFASCVLLATLQDKKTLEANVENYLQSWRSILQQKLHETFCNKLGFIPSDKSYDKPIQAFLQLLEDNKLDFTNSFRSIAQLIHDPHEDHSLKHTQRELRGFKCGYTS
ncbi:MAG: YdiU family protein [Bdellovibrionota bacterium]